MVIFYYDKTFEGLLTAVFDAYDRKTFPDQLLAEGDPGPIFAESFYTVITQKEKSDRVWKGLEKKMGKELRNMVVYTWLSEEPGCDQLLFRYLRKIFDSPHTILTDFADGDILQVKNLARKVNRDKRYIIQFVRFQKAADDIFFAPVSPRYNSLPLSLYYFKDRFADQQWVIYDVKRKYGYYYDKKKITEISILENDHILSGKLDEHMMAEDEKTFQELWKNYFKALTIKERLNFKLQRQNMPRRFWKFLTEKQS